MSPLDIAHIEFGVTLLGSLAALIIYMSWARWRNPIGIWLVLLNAVVLVWIAKGFIATNVNTKLWNLAFFGIVAALMVSEAAVFFRILRLARRDAEAAICAECGQPKVRMR